MDDWSSLPLFPLNTVLFPGMMLPLHIFEERYKLMINRCLAENRPFGVVLIREGQEVGGEAVPYRVGTTSAIAAVTHTDDGRMNIITIGAERFRLRSVRSSLPYLVGDAEPWPLAGADADDVQDLVEPMQAMLRQYISLLTMAQGHKINVDQVPNDPQTLAWLVAIVLQIPMVEKQHLLGRPTARAVLAGERALMQREQLILSHIANTQADQWEGGHSGYLARN